MPLDVLKFGKKRAEKMDEKIEGVQFSPIFREDTLGDFKDICKDNYKDFLKLFSIKRY